MLINLAFWAVLALLAVWLFRAFSTGRNSAGGDSPAVEILKRRYAAGEIDSDEFEQMRRNLLKF